MRYIYIVRHGERMDNFDPKWKDDMSNRAWDDPPLSARGHIQAQEVGRKLASENVKIDHVFSSPFLRCVQTTDHILRELNKVNGLEEHHLIQNTTENQVLYQQPLKIRIEPGICETLHVCQNPAGFLELDELRSLFPVIDHTHEEIIPKHKLPTEFTAKCCFPRAQSTLKQIIENFSGNILIVSHGCPITAFHAYLSKKFHYMGQCTISKYVAEEPTKIESKLNTSRVSSNNGSIAVTITNDKTKSGISTIIDVDDTTNTKNEESICNDLLPQKLSEEWTFQCEYADDSSHLSDASSLRGLSCYSEKEISGFKKLISEYFTD